MADRRERPWRKSEERALAILAELGTVQLMVLFDRSSLSIRSKAHELRISVKRISQITATELQPAVLEYVMTRNPDMLCPVCAKRLIAISSTGLCGACHKGLLIEAHNARLTELEQQREINRLKKAEQRLRDELGIIPPRSRRAREGAVTALEE